MQSYIICELRLSYAQFQSTAFTTGIPVFPFSMCFIKCVILQLYKYAYHYHNTIHRYQISISYQITSFYCYLFREPFDLESF